MTAPIWPFPTENSSQFRRVDQGWDLQYAGTTPVDVLAVESGTLETGGPDPGGFGTSYPVLKLDTPINGHNAIYYGHTFPDMTLIGQHVSQGQPIGKTGGAHSGGDAYSDPNWLEIGFWPPGAMGTGQAMKDWLSGATPASGGNVQTAGLFNPLNPASWLGLVPGLFGLGDWKDLAERLGLILLGAALVLIGLRMLTEKRMEKAVGLIMGVAAPEAKVAGTVAKAGAARNLAKTAESGGE